MNHIQWETIRSSIDAGVAWFTLHRPEHGNRVNPTMAAEFDRACTLITQDDDIRVIVVAGFGDAFCAGGPTPQEALSASESLRVAASIAALEKPVIAALNGDAIGQGLEIALACDIRLAADGARMGMPQISEGGIPWDGGTQRLPRVVGRAWATDLLLTGRLVDADEALRIGLVHRVVALADLVAATTELAAAIAASAPVATRYAKETVLKGMDMTLEQGLRLEVDLNLLLQTTSDRAEGIASFLERRTPRYTGE